VVEKTVCRAGRSGKLPSRIRLFTIDRILECDIDYIFLNQNIMKLNLFIRDSNIAEFLNDHFGPVHQPVHAPQENPQDPKRETSIKGGIL